MPSNNARAPRSILITGASGGLGSALANEYAGPGQTLALWGRNAQRLETVQNLCRSKGATTVAIRQDMRDELATRAALLALDDAYTPDLVFLNAGSTIAMAAAIVPRMLERRAGHLVFISSLAALYPLPSSPSYCAAKAAISMYARAVRLNLANSGVRISIVYPGYVDTPMSRRLKGPQPQRWSAPKAAAHIHARLDAGTEDIIFPALLGLGIRVLQFLPEHLAAFFARRFSFTIEPDAESAYAPRQAAKPRDET